MGASSVALDGYAVSHSHNQRAEGGDSLREIVLLALVSLLVIIFALLIVRAVL
jgi:hypothetical protein